ncbi:hypothetical protein CYLTODRAFT_340791 [Cylindrobasidium torrendii FP15055 ss-10]|uniref:HAD-like protein n=1 Tax=Cylindrobasidium torrendii FP15055 ss-10 TaxID=1314674 RepID=A0A0D7BVH2_9AGAR|nr:hypothetical protein CYLTODRAFT_340791 [Cylindrobasidium torrendii FP15055 ss-10]
MIGEFRLTNGVQQDGHGTLANNIAAVEAAWTQVAHAIGKDPQHVIAFTQGKRAKDNLRALRPELARLTSDDMVDEFEQSIFALADARRLGLGNVTPAGSGATTPALSDDGSSTSSTASSLCSSTSPLSRPLFVTRLSDAILKKTATQGAVSTFMPTFEDDDGENLATKVVEINEELYEAEDLSVQILPGAREMIESIPKERYAVATSAAETYAHGCLSRVGIDPPKVTITKKRQDHPDPFYLAADCLGYDIRKCVVFQDSPSGIMAAMASGATVVAVCTSYPREEIEKCGAHFIVDTMEAVHCEALSDRLRFTIHVG